MTDGFKRVLRFLSAASLASCLLAPSNPNLGPPVANLAYASRSDSTALDSLLTAVIAETEVPMNRIRRSANCRSSVQPPVAYLQGSTRV